MTRKGGGRESGTPAETRRRVEPAGSDAAANPAAHSKHCWCYDCNPPTMHERIRELEAELARSCSRPQVHAHLLARAERAEARLKQHETEIAIADAQWKKLKSALQKALHARDERSLSAQRE